MKGISSQQRMRYAGPLTHRRTGEMHQGWASCALVEINGEFQIVGGQWREPPDPPQK